MHRRENWHRLDEIVECILAVAKHLPVRIPLHPSVEDALIPKLAGENNVTMLRPLDYEESLHHVASACIVMTDSGGLQEEASLFGTKLIILRDETERPEVIEAGLGTLSYDPLFIEAIAKEASRGYLKKPLRLYGNGTAGIQISSILRKAFSNE